MVSKKIYFFIDKIDEINLDQVKKTGAILIFRTSKNISRKSLKKFASNCKSKTIDKELREKSEKLASDCKRKRIDLFVANSLKLQSLLKTNRFYISAWNKKYYKNLRKFNSNIEIVGSAHNVKEIKEKIDQGCSQIFLSRIFETKYRLKKGFLGVNKFNLMTRRFITNFIALGGINIKNFNQVKSLNIIGFAMSLDKKKAGKYIPAFFKKTY